MELEKMFRDHNCYHSEFQIDNFIIAKNGYNTIYGMYKQSLRELYKRFRALKDAYYNNEKLKLSIKNYKNLIEEMYNSNKKDMIKLKLVKKQYDLVETQKAIFDTEKEFIYFYKHCVFYKKKLPELTDETIKKLDKEFWINNIKYNMAIEFIANGRISKNLCEMVLMSDYGIKQEFLKYIKNPSFIVEWFENQKNNNYIDEIHKIECNFNVKNMIEGEKHGA